MSDKSPAEIEREIEVERAELSRTLDSLSDRFSVDHVVGQVSGQVREHGGEIAANLARTVKQAPAAAVLTGIGLAWMMIASGRSESYAREPVRNQWRSRRDADLRRYDYEPVGEGSYDSPSYLASDYPSQDREALDRPPPAPAYATTPSRPTATGFRRGEPSGSFKSRVAAANAAEAQRAASIGPYDDDGFLDRLGDQAEGLWGTITANVRGAWRRTYASAADMRARLMEGTDDMDDEGKDRVARARAMAYQAQARAEMMARRGRAQASNFFYDQPMVAGALAMAVGAVVGGLLPRTQREDQAFGAYRDQLFADAEAVFQEERHRAEAAAKAALGEAKEIARETVGSVTGKTPDGRETVAEADREVRSAASRVAGAAKQAHDSA